MTVKTKVGGDLDNGSDAAAERTTLGLGTLATQSGTFSGTSSGTNTGDQTNITGNAATVTTNANLTGDVTSVGNATTLSTAKAPVAHGRIKISGTVGYQLPGVSATSASTDTLAINTMLYAFIVVDTTITIDQCGFVVTVTPATNANVRVGIYAADTDMQPTGAAVFDVGVAVANGFTGVKTAVATAILTPGRYLTAMNCDVAMSIRVWRGSTYQGFVDLSLGAGVLTGGTIASTYGVMPNPGPAYTAYRGVGDHSVALHVSVP